MNTKNLTEFLAIKNQCSSGQLRSINVASKVRSDAIVAAWDEIVRLREALEAAAMNAGKYEDGLAQKIGETYDNLSSAQKFSLEEFGFFELIEQAKRVRTLCAAALEGGDE